ncbi:hypothetical protein [Roseitranquillus sediminis]|uniref:hypothetical protein n=1 Tax=Roseitranquillus sediminis TaxID=2809051 RepID=UPI001D0C6BBB|nr:hypothetical protein [Roseitranquillus sediminis]MBM9593565.1 hypothetical protein [Roseitranquillus sediminis]
MPDIENMTPGEVLAEASVADFIKALGLSIAEAQRALDENSVDQIGEFIRPREGLDGRSLLDLGLSPAFYHYQHADISCSMQLSLRVEKDLSVGVNLSGSFSDTSTSDENRSESTTSTESGSTEVSRERTAEIEIQSASTGAVSIGGREFQLSGGDPLTRIRALQEAVRSDASAGVPRLLYEPTPRTFTITTDAPPDRVHTTSNTVAFLGSASDFAIIQIDANADTSYVFNGTTTIATTAQGDLDTYAAHVEAQVQAAGYTTLLASPTSPLVTVNFATGLHHFQETNPDGPVDNTGDRSRLKLIALVARARNLAITVQGYADAQRYPGGQAISDQENRRLGDRRAAEIKAILESYGADPARVKITPSTGAADANADVTAGGSRANVNFRRVDVRIPGRPHWLSVKSNTAAQAMSGIDPDRRAPGSTGNGFIFLLATQALSLSGMKCTIDGTDFPFSGSAAGGHASGSAEAYAVNLRDDINGNASVDYQASADGNIVTVFGKSSPFKVTLLTAENRQIQLSGRDGVSIKREFTRTSTSSLTRQNTGNRTVAVGASVDVRFGRQFEMNVTGNSAISARLVSIPAPPQFLETIKEYLRQDNEG